MGIFGWILYILLGFILFIGILFLEKKYQLSKIEKLVLSVLFLMISSGVCGVWKWDVNENIFLIFLFLMIFDLIYSSYFLERDFFDKKEGNILYYACLLLVGFVLNQTFINQVDQVFLSGEDIRLLLWGFMILFIYRFCKEKNVFSKRESIVSSFMSQDAILRNYAKLKFQYYDVCNTGDKTFSNILYSVMILENYKRSKIIRDYDYFMFRLKGMKKKLGIMQIETDKYISDVESIEIASKKLEKLYKGKKKMSSLEVFEKYLGEDALKAQMIFDIIKKI